MKKVFIYQIYFDPLDLIVKKIICTYNIIAEYKDKYLIEKVTKIEKDKSEFFDYHNRLRHGYDSNSDKFYLYKSDNLLNGIFEYDIIAGEASTISEGALIYDEEKDDEKRKIELINNTNKKIEKKIYEINEKVKKMNEYFKIIII